MRSGKLLWFAAVLVIVCGAGGGVALAGQQEAAEGHIGPDGLWHEREALKELRLRWWSKARFGMFIHWGLYAIPAGQWKGEKSAGYSEWIMWKKRIPAAEYAKLADQFNPVKFDARKWVSLARRAGMKYMVITAKHHDGFAMYHSKVSSYNIVDATPFGRDPISELSRECRRQGIRFGCYYSVDRDWHHPAAFCANQGEGNTWDYPNTTREDFDRYLKAKALPQLRELLVQYGPLDIIWFDGVGTKTPQQNEQIIAMVRILQPDCLINSRLGDWKSFKWGDYRSMDDDRVADRLLPYGWENPGTLNKTYGYNKFATDYKSPSAVIQLLVDIASKGGNYLLNVGPTAEGVIPEQAVRILEAVGRWLEKNGESIYATEGSCIGRPAWGRCTVKPGKLYLHIFDLPEDGKVVVPPVQGKVDVAYFLADEQKKPLKFEQRDNGEVVIGLKTDNTAVFDPADTVVVLRLGQ